MLPQRKYSAGAAPSITTAEVIGPIARDKTKSKFYSPVRCPNNEEKLEILHVMVRTGIQTVMSNHMYRWNNLVMLQTRGGGIGDKLAQAAARLFMIWWDSQFLLVLKTAELTITLYKRYVDDGNCKVIAVPPGSCWDDASKRIVQGVLPESDVRPPDMRTAEVIWDIANGVTSMFSSSFTPLALYPPPLPFALIII